MSDRAKTEAALWTARKEIERLTAELFTMRNVFHQQDAKIERLTAEREKYAAAWLRVDGERLKLKLEAHNLQARVEVLEGALQKIVDEIPPNEHKKWRHHHHYLVIARKALAATEQEQIDHKGRPMTYWGGREDTEQEVSDE